MNHPCVTWPVYVQPFTDYIKVSKNVKIMTQSPLGTDDQCMCMLIFNQKRFNICKEVTEHLTKSEQPVLKWLFWGSRP